MKTSFKASLLNHFIAKKKNGGFTLIELLVVLAIIALMMTIAAPRYIDRVEMARETTLISSLKVMREAIDKFDGDQGRLPVSLAELVERRYLKEIPVDPMTDRNDSWIESGPVYAAAQPDPALAGMADVRSGATGEGRNGKPFKDW